MGPVISAVAGKAAEAIPAVAKAAGNVAAQVPNAATYQQQDTSQAEGTSSAAGKLGEAQVQALPIQAEQAKGGIQQVAETEQKVVAPVAKQATEATQEAIKVSGEAQQTALDAYRNAVQQTNIATQEAGDAIQAAASKAKIDPERYQKNLGVGGKTLSAIGMILSGIGSGLTGQPNMAMDVFQKNIQRDIESQQVNYQNLMEVAAQKKGLLQSAQDRQIIAANALFAAQHSVLSGAKSAVEAAASQAKAQSATSAAQPLMFMLNQALLKSTDEHAQMYKTINNSGNLNWQNILGVAATTVSDKMLGTDLSLSKKNVQQRARNATPTASAAPTEQPINLNKDFYEQFSKVKEQSLKQGE